MRINPVLIRAYGIKRQEKAESLAKAAELLRANKCFDACTHAAYYSTYHAILARALFSGAVDLRVSPQRYAHKEVPGLAQKCVGSTIVVTYGGAKRNYSVIQAVLELQGKRRVADYEPSVDDEQNAEKAYQILVALRGAL